MNPECGDHLRLILTNRIMKSQNTFMVICALFLFQGNCNSPIKPNPIVGLWSFVDKNSTYWEEIYTDSLFWVYSDEVGISKRRYEIEKNIIKQRYLDGSAYLNYEILKASRNSILFICEGEKGELKRIDEIYDLDQITAGDTALKWKYVQDYRRRKFAWENRAGN